MACYTMFDRACPAPATRSTATITPCPPVWPGVWATTGKTYADILEFKAAVEQYTSAPLVLDRCSFTAPAGTVLPPLQITPAPVAVLPTKTCGVTNAAGTYAITVPSGYIGRVDVAMPPDTAVTLSTTVGASNAPYAPNGECWCMSNVDTTPLSMGQGTIYNAGAYILATTPPRAGLDVCVTPVAMAPSEIAKLCPNCGCA